MDKCCGNCAYHQYYNKTDDWVCCNAESENVADWTDFNDSCMDWEGKEDVD